MGKFIFYIFIAHNGFILGCLKLFIMAILIIFFRVAALALSIRQSPALNNSFCRMKLPSAYSEYFSFTIFKILCLVYFLKYIISDL